jgi:CRISPR-associated protein Cas5d
MRLAYLDLCRQRHFRGPLMSFGVRLHVVGQRACFTRPEMKAERVSYDVITPSAARGILEAIYWKPAIRWVIDTIHVLKPIRFESIRRNEVGSKISEANVKSAMKSGRLDGLALVVNDDRQQRASTILRDVEYLIEAHFDIVQAKAGTDNNEAKHLEMFRRRAEKGQCFHQPCLGTREFAAEFSLLDGDAPKSKLTGERDLGWMLYDIDFANGMAPLFYRPVMHDGVIDVAKYWRETAR